MAGNFVEREDNVFEEIEVDEGEVLVGNKNTVLKENDVIVLDDSEKENEKVQALSVADEAHTAHKGIKVYTSQSTTPDQRRALLFNVGEPFEVSMNEFDSECYKNHTNSNSWKAFACRLMKHNHSSGRKEGIPTKKRRKTK
ncbi:22714_t:CDS:2, partial [Racocetra persica]